MMNKESLVNSPGFRRILPFAAYMVFILAADLIQPLLPPGVLSDNFAAVIYPIKILAVTAILIFYWKSYDELRLDNLKMIHYAVAFLTGIAVFVLWINMDWEFATLGASESYDPGTLSGAGYYSFIAVRLAGSSLVVPVFEEIFWRSFVLRYFIDQDFTRVKIGTFTWASFLITSVLFGSEHHLWLAGIMAGVLYNCLLYWSKNISVCIFAHGVTNLLLGIYVVKTGSWQFW